VPLAAAAAVVFMGTWLNRPGDPHYRMAAAESAPDKTADAGAEVLMDEVAPTLEADDVEQPRLANSVAPKAATALPADSLSPAPVSVTLADPGANDLDVTVTADALADQADADVVELREGAAVERKRKLGMKLEEAERRNKPAAAKGKARNLRADAIRGGGVAAIPEPAVAPAEDFAAAAVDVKKNAKPKETIGKAAPQSKVAEPNDPFLAADAFNDDAPAPTTDDPEALDGAFGALQALEPARGGGAPPAPVVAAPARAELAKKSDHAKSEKAFASAFGGVAAPAAPDAGAPGGVAEAELATDNAPAPKAMKKKSAELLDATTRSAARAAAPAFQLPAAVLRKLKQPITDGKQLPRVVPFSSNGVEYVAVVLPATTATKLSQRQRPIWQSVDKNNGLVYWVLRLQDAQPLGLKLPSK
jgi:hypothetical protein